MVLTYCKPWFCVVDPELKDTTSAGHYVVYDRAVCEAAERLGYRTLILGRKTIDATHIGDTPVIPAFTHGIWETDPKYQLSGEGERRGRLRAGYRFFRELRKALAPIRLKSDSFVFVQSVYGLQIFGWALFGLWSWLVRGPKVAILLRYQHEFYDDQVSTLGFRILERLVWAGHVRFVTDSQRLADDYSVLTKAPFDVVPIPHAQVPEPAETAKAGSWLRFGTLGGARDEKGIEEIVDAIELLNRHNLASQIQFVLHVHSSWPDAITEKLAKFKIQLPENVNLIEDPLDDKKYQELLYSLDVLILPYWRRIYRSRTSGPLIEGIAAGKVVIVTRDTWLHDEMKQHGAGVTCEDRSPVDLARAIMETAARFEELHLAAQARRSDASKHHDAEQFIAQITDLFRTKKMQIDRGASVVIAPWPLDSNSLQSGMGTRIQCLIQFLAWHSRIVCVASPGGDGFEGPRNMIVRRLYGPPWSTVAKYSAFIYKFGNLARHNDDMWSAALLVQHLRGCFYRRFRQDLKRLIFRFDRVFLEYSILAMPALGIARRQGASTVVSDYDVISNQIRTPWLRKLVLWFECYGLRRADYAVAVSKEDSEFFASHGVRNTLVPNCVDPRRLTYFLPIEPQVILKDLFDIDFLGRPVIFFAGTAHPPNVEAVDAIKRMAVSFNECDPATPLYVVAGQCHAPDNAANFLALGLVDELALSALYATAALVLIPLPYGTGMSLKTVEAMALGKAIIGTRVGFRGIDVTAGVECEIEDDITAYPRHIVRLLADAASRELLGHNARRASEPFHFWNAMKAYTQLLQMPVAPAEIDLRQDQEMKARQLTRALDKARERGRLMLVDQLEYWWLNSAPEHKQEYRHAEQEIQTRRDSYASGAGRRAVDHAPSQSIWRGF